MSTGGASAENVAEWFSAGAVAVGVGGAPAPPALDSADERRALIGGARRRMAAVHAARGAG
jgi:2-keto-3-deoxy-6-phosphogluconate aldolase